MMEQAVVVTNRTLRSVKRQSNHHHQHQHTELPILSFSNAKCLPVTRKQCHSSNGIRRLPTKNVKRKLYSLNLRNPFSARIFETVIHICCWYVFQGPVIETSYWGSWQHFDWSCWYTDIHTNTSDLTASLPNSTNEQQSLDRRLKLEPEVDKEADDHGQYQSDDCYTQLKQLVVFFVTKPAHQLYITIIFITNWFPLPLPLPLLLFSTFV